MRELNYNAKMERNYKILYGQLMWIVSVIISVFTSILILTDVFRPNYYEWLPILPLAFGITILLNYQLYLHVVDNLSVLLIILLYSIRNVITPLFMYFGNYYGSFKMLNEYNVNKAIILMIYESCIVFSFIYFLQFRAIKVRNIQFRNRTISKSKQKISRGIIFLLVFIAISAYILVPEIKTNYASIFNTSEVVGELGAYEILPSGSINRMLYTLFNLIFNIVQIFVSDWLIIKIKKYIKSDNVGVILSLFVIFSQFLFMSGENGYTLIVAFVLLNVVYREYHSKRKLLNLIAIIMGVTFILLIYIAKVNSINTGSSAINLSQMLQAYFPGVSNLAGVFNIINPNKMTTLFFDFYNMIPFRGTLFGLQGDTLVSIYTYQNAAIANILPSVGQAYHYLGFVFAPLVPCVFVYISINYNRKLKYSVNIWEYSTYLLILIFSATTPIMYNTTIFGARFFGTMLPMLLISNFSKEKI